MTLIFRAVLDMSIGAGLLALIIFLIRGIIGRRLAVIMPVLCALLIAKLLIPISVQSPLSIQNIWTMHTPQVSTTLPDTDTTPSAPESADNDIAADTTNPDTLPADQTNSTIETAVHQQQISVWQPSAMDIVALIWLAGMAVLTLCVAAGNIRFMCMLRCNRPYSAPGFDTMLADCKRAYNIKKHISVITVSGINTAAVYGVLKPKLLISPDTFGRLSAEEQRHILMHELSHIKSRDTLICLILTAVNIVHWFNPLVWAAFTLLRQDLEVICDTHVLNKLGAGQKHSYACTLVGLLKKPNAKPLPLVTAMFIQKNNIKRRIKMISRYKKRTPLSAAVALVLTIIIAVTGCTTAAQNTDPLKTGVPEATSAPTEPGAPAVSPLSKLPSSYVFDFSSYAQDTTRVENIRKAAVLLDGSLIQSSEDNGLIFDMDISAEKGWLEAPSLGWPDYIDVMTVAQWSPQLSDTQSYETPQIGGGIDLVLAAIYKAFNDLNIPGIELGFYEEMFGQGGDLVISSSNESDILIRLSVTDTSLTVTLYEISGSTLASSLDNVITTYTFDYSTYSDSAELSVNIEKAVSLLDGTVIAPNEQIDIIEIFAPITDTNGWKNAPGIIWNQDMNSWEATEGITYNTHIGGGIDLVIYTLYEAAMAAGLDQITDIGIGGEDFAAGYFAFANHNDTSVVIHADTSGNIIVIEICSAPSSGQTVENTATVTPELIVSFELDYSAHESTGAYYNVEKAAALLDGAVIAPGQELSLNEVLGPRNVESDWKGALGIVGSAYVSQIGGGVSAVSNALYNAAIRAELNITTSRPHTIVPDYVPGGLDATISTGGPDLKIINPYDVDITIRCRFKDGNVTVDIYGPPLEYTVDFTSELVSTGDTPETIYYYNAETTPAGEPVPEGQSVQYIQAMPDKTYVVYKTLYDLDGSEIETMLFRECTYRGREGVVYVNAPEPK